MVYAEHFSGFRGKYAPPPLKRRPSKSKDQAVCGTRNAILITPGMDAEITCKKCQVLLNRYGLPLEGDPLYDFEERFTKGLKGHEPDWIICDDPLMMPEVDLE